MTSPACPNCGTAMVGRYCSSCGQQEIHTGDLTLTHASHHLVHEMAHVDGRLWGTLRLLLTRPGQLSLDFLEGRRQRHLHPVRVFLVAAALFFFFGNATVLRLEHIETRAPSAKSMIEAQAANRGLSRQAYLEARNPVLQTTYKLGLLPLVFFMGLVQALLFRNRHPELGGHLTVAAHNQSAVFLAGLPLGWLAAWSLIPVAPLVAGAVFSVVYSWLAFRRVYGDGVAATALKTVALIALSTAWSMAAMGFAFRRALR